MYLRYDKNRMISGSIRYCFREQVSLFGCNVGFIPRLLRLGIPPTQNEPYTWHLNIEEALESTAEYRGSALVIDLKPKQQKNNLSLYELLDVWGYSLNGWTPILLHVSGLFVDADPNSFDRNDFSSSESVVGTPIYEVLYLDGSVENGKLIGRWNAPPASPTNAALLWPETLKYFVQSIRERTPDVLKF